jgi:hypothetical protein
VNVLAVVATASGLPKLATSEELARIQETPGVSLRVVTDATASRVARMLSQEQFDAMLWIGHGEAGYLLTQDGRIDPQWLAAQLGTRRIRTAIIATCLSNVRPENGPQAAQSFADALPAAGIDTITMQTAVSDRAAIEFDVELLTQLAAGLSLRTAYQVALNRAAQFGEVQAPQLSRRDSDQQADVLRNMDARVEDIQDTQRQMQHSLDRLEERLAVVERDLRQMHNPHIDRQYLVVGAVVMAAMLILLLFVTWRLI